MDIRKPVSAWILARLYKTDDAVPRRVLIRSLCQASFDAMSSDNDFDATIKALLNDGMLEIGMDVSSYQISDKGLFAFRRQLGIPMEEIRDNIDKISPVRQAKFKDIVVSLKSGADLMDTICSLCVKNAPAVLVFITEMSQQLSALGINIHL